MTDLLSEVALGVAAVIAAAKIALDAALAWRNRNEATQQEIRSALEQQALEECRSKLDRMADTLRLIQDGVRKLTELHGQRDENGVPVWYVRRGLYDSVQRIERMVERLLDRTGPERTGRGQRS